MLIQGYKLKIWKDKDQKAKELSCIKTQLGPVYGSPIVQMEELDLSRNVYIENGVIKSNKLSNNIFLLIVPIF